jgi:hypothetical protein
VKANATRQGKWQQDTGGGEWCLKGCKIYFLKTPVVSLWGLLIVHKDFERFNLGEKCFSNKVIGL